MMQNELLTADASTAGAIDFEAAVEGHYESLYKFAFGLTGNESDAADLTQDTYRILLTKGREIKNQCKIKSWLFTTLYRQFLGRRRHATRFPETTFEVAELELPIISPDLEDRLDGSLVVATLQELEEKYRAPLVLFYLEGVSYKQMAAILGLPIGTIMSRLSRGKEILRANFCKSSPATASNRISFFA